MVADAPGLPRLSRGHGRRKNSPCPRSDAHLSVTYRHLKANANRRYARWRLRLAAASRAVQNGLIWRDILANTP